MTWKSSFQLISKSERSVRVVVRTVYVILSHLIFVQCEHFESTETNRTRKRRCDDVNDSA